MEIVWPKFFGAYIGSFMYINNYRHDIFMNISFLIQFTEKICQILDIS